MKISWFFAETPYVFIPYCGWVNSYILAIIILLMLLAYFIAQRLPSRRPQITLPQTQEAPTTPLLTAPNPNPIADAIKSVFNDPSK